MMERIIAVNANCYHGYSIEEAIAAMKLPALEIFTSEYLPAYYLTLDELG